MSPSIICLSTILEDLKNQNCIWCIENQYINFNSVFIYHFYCTFFLLNSTYGIFHRTRFSVGVCFAPTGTSKKTVFYNFLEQCMWCPFFISTSFYPLNRNIWTAVQFQSKLISFSSSMFGLFIMACNNMSRCHKYCSWFQKFLISSKILTPF